MNYEFPLQRREVSTDDARPERQTYAPGHATELAKKLPTGVEDIDRSLVWEILEVIRRHVVGLCVWVLLCLAAAATYLVAATPEFVATAQIVLEPRQEVALGSDANAASLSPTLDSAQAESQIQVIKSGRNLRYVFDAQDLASSPAYADNGRGLVQTITQLPLQVLAAVPGLSAVLKPDDMSPEERARISKERAFQTFVDTVTVRRLGQSYVMEVAVRALSPSDAVRLANGVTMSYIRDQVQVRAASEQRRSDFLQNRITVIQSEKLVATKSVADGVIPDFQFPDSDARVVSAALEPLTKSYPQTKLLLLLAAMFGMVSGMGAIMTRQSLDRTIRSRDQVRRVLGIDCLCVFPRVPGPRGLEGLSYGKLLDRPDSEFAAALRALRASLFAPGKAEHGIAVGIVSCRSGEGGSTIASNLAQLRASSGDRVILIDADLRNPWLSRKLAPAAARGLNDLLLNRTDSDRFPEIELAPSLAFVPAVRAGDKGDPNAFLGSHALQDALSRLDGDRDLLVDLPPLDGSSDAQAIGPLLTGMILVAALNRTTLDQLAEAVRSLSAANVRLLGIVLNDIEPSRGGARGGGRRSSSGEARREGGQASGSSI